MKKKFLGFCLPLVLIGCVDLPSTVTFMKPTASSGVVKSSSPCGGELIRFSPQKLDWVVFSFAASPPNSSHTMNFGMAITKELFHFINFGSVRTDEWQAKRDTLIGIRIAKPTIKFSWENGGHAEQEMAAFISLDQTFDYTNNFVIPEFSGDWLDVDLPAFAIALDHAIPSVATQKETINIPRIRFTRTSETTFISIRCG